MTEYISREEALNFELEIEAKPEDIQAITKGMALYADYIKSIPVADVVERKTGKWEQKLVPVFDGGVIVVPGNVCSACGGITTYNTSLFEYCPRCGASMNQKGD